MNIYNKIKDNLGIDCVFVSPCTRYVGKIPNYFVDVYFKNKEGGRDKIRYKLEKNHLFLDEFDVNNLIFEINANRRV